MTESNIHKMVKYGVATTLQQNGFDVNTEYKSREGEGVIDV
jgi:hypothetical protein